MYKRQLFDDVISLWLSEYLRISYEGTDTITRYDFHNEGFVLDTSDCFYYQELNVSYTFRLRDKVGIEEFTEFVSVYFDRTTLVGHRIDGVSTGDVDIISGMNETQASRNVMIFPNPAQDVLFLKSPTTLNALDYRIFNNIGELKKSGNYRPEGINIADLEPGIYFLKIEMDDKAVVKMFVKN